MWRGLVGSDTKLASSGARLTANSGGPSSSCRFASSNSERNRSSAKAHNTENRNLAAVGHAMKQRRGGCEDVFYWLNAVFALDTVSEKGRFGALGGIR